MDYEVNVVITGIQFKDLMKFLIFCDEVLDGKCMVTRGLTIYHVDDNERYEKIINFTRKKQKNDELSLLLKELKDKEVTEVTPFYGLQADYFIQCSKEDKEFKELYNDCMFSKVELGVNMSFFDNNLWSLDHFVNSFSFGGRIKQRFTYQIVCDETVVLENPSSNSRDLTSLCKTIEKISNPSLVRRKHSKVSPLLGRIYRKKFYNTSKFFYFLSSVLELYNEFEVQYPITPDNIKGYCYKNFTIGDISEDVVDTQQIVSMAINKIVSKEVLLKSLESVTSNNANGNFTDMELNEHYLNVLTFTCSQFKNFGYFSRSAVGDKITFDVPPSCNELQRCQIYFCMYFSRIIKDIFDNYVNSLGELKRSTTLKLYEENKVQCVERACNVVRDIVYSLFIDNVGVDFVSMIRDLSRIFNVNYQEQYLDLMRSQEPREIILRGIK